MKAAFLPVLAAALLAVSAAAQAAPRERITRITVYGNDPCPVSETEIVVCARRPNQERYRIPEELRSNADDPASQSWAQRAESLEYVGRTGTQSCSTVGPGGFTGCWEQLMRTARRERARAR
ncbi:MAG: hypothetical protein JOZ90_09690 [Alphaproteobacteria bacterium]|nr:hypothetical protein [Alphaproteobacteria bacterium]MBV9372988.1 hypothetical protein [Alphaproteobacteria bacterium]MBV9901355.1 hypothetical protein [Alphaproteobacteria bacterium]